MTSPMSPRPSSRMVRSSMMVMSGRGALHPAAVPQRRGVAPPADDHRVGLQRGQGRVQPLACGRVARLVDRVVPVGTADSTGSSSRAATTTATAVDQTFVAGRRPGRSRSPACERQVPQPVDREPAQTHRDQHGHQVVAVDVRVRVAQQEPRTAARTRGWSGRHQPRPAPDASDQAREPMPRPRHPGSLPARPTPSWTASRQRAAWRGRCP